jgi:ribosomal-protein-serine acetyltransferase
MSLILNVDSHIVLTLVKPEDAEEIFTLVDVSRNYLRKWLPWVDLNTTSQDTKEFIYSAQKQDLNNSGFHCCIKYKDKIAGIVGFHRLDWLNKTGELAYWLGKQYQGIGLMTKSCKVLTDYGFNQLKLERIEILTNNPKSSEIPKRLGFTQEITLYNAEQIGDRFVDNVVYAMLLQDWQINTENLGSTTDTNSQK